MALARPIALQALQRKASELDQAFEGEVRELTSASQARASSVFRRACSSVRDSAEANEVRRLRHELATREAALAARREQAEDEAWEDVYRLQGAHEVERESIAARRRAAHVDLLKGHQYAAHMAGIVGVLCAAVDCRKPFDPTKPLRAQCDVNGCASASLYCGCTFRRCRSCLMSMCHFHSVDHDDACDGRMRCGYVSNEDEDEGKGRLHPECCNKLLDEEKLASPRGKGENERLSEGLLGLFEESPESPDARTQRKRQRREERHASVYKCFNCHATVCGACCQFCSGKDSEYMCSGRDCLKVWCKACVLPTANLSASCCRQCDFHHRKWF
jgi:hypothetical protein